MTRWPNWRAMFGRLRGRLPRRQRPTPEPPPARPWRGPLPPSFLHGNARESTAWRHFIGNPRRTRE